MRADGEAGRGGAAEGIEWGRRGLGAAGSGKVEGSTAWQSQSQSQSQGDAEGRNTSAGRGDWNQIHCPSYVAVRSGGEKML